MKRFLLISLLLILSAAPSFSQVVFENSESRVYEYLSDMSKKGIIDYNAAIKPIARLQIAKYLNVIRQNSRELTGIERDELEFYSKDFNEESKPNDGQMRWIKNGNERYRLFEYRDSLFNISLDPVFGMEVKSLEHEKHSWNGFNAMGSIGKNWGFSFRFKDNHVNKIPALLESRYSDQQAMGYVDKTESGTDFDDVNGCITYSWNWGDFSVLKDYNAWGSGRDGQLILSSKAPSFPMVKLRVYPADWLSFVYMHGVLNSTIPDSSTLRHSTSRERDHFNDVEKYYVSHILSIKLKKNLYISLGESVIYSDRFEPIYLVPVLFFRAADHYLCQHNETSGNAQVYADINYKLQSIQTEFYGSFFLDEFSLSGLLNNEERPQAVAYTAGFESVVPYVNDMIFNAEYTRINPMVYFHADDAQLYQNYGTGMGQWIGANADRVHFALRKKIIRGLNISLNYNYIRRGQPDTLGMERYRSYQKFLYGTRSNYHYLDLSASYELVHSLVFAARYHYEKITGTLPKNTTTPGKYLSCSVSYGI
jgi:hypothetical protein